MAVERHQLAGVDDRERGFSRTVQIHNDQGGHRATFRYEQVQLQSEPAETSAAALLALIRCLHERGYTQVRSQLSFREGEYLGSQEPWVEYPDPARPSALRRILAFLGRLFGGA